MSVIISLTTTSGRLHLCKSALFSLVTQSLTPTKVVLNLSSMAYLKDEGIHDLKMIDYLLEGIDESLKEIIHINWVDNTGPYRKLIPTLKAAKSNDIIVTADDDIIYNNDWLKLLLQDFNAENMLVHAGRVRRIKKSSLGSETGYIYWPIVKEKTIIDNDWVITFGGGAVLYRGWFSEKLISDSAYLDIAPTNDDLWYTKLCKISNLRVRIIPEALNSLNFIRHNDGLENENLPKAKTNSFLSKLKYKHLDRRLNYYKIFRFGNDIAFDSINEYFSRFSYNK